MAVSSYNNRLRPGVYLSTVTSEPAPALETGVPVLIGLVPAQRVTEVAPSIVLSGIGTTGMFRLRFPETDPDDARFPAMTSLDQAQALLGPLASSGFLFPAVRGFFENGGKRCRICVLAFEPTQTTALAAFGQALSDIGALSDIDLVCAPDIMALFQQGGLVSMEDVLAMQNNILIHCMVHAGRFAVLDTLPGSDTRAAVTHRKKLTGDSGALYYPWLQTEPRTGAPAEIVPPCGHVCGIYARSDNHTGVFKAPANEEIYGVTDVETRIGNSEQDTLNPNHVNAIRSFPGRGIRIFGARTLSRYPEWAYVNVRRLFLTFSRWLDLYMVNISFEPNDPTLWGRVNRDIAAYLDSLYSRGALKGASPREAYFIRCDETTNTEERRNLGRLVTEIGLAPACPCEFIVVRVTHSDSGTRIDAGPDLDTTVISPNRPPDLEGLSDVVITHIEYSPPGRDVDGEYVVIENRSDRAAELGNWTLRDRAGHVYRFPEYTLEAGTQCRIRTGTGTDTATTLYWNMGTAVWNNTGDRAVLRNKQGLTRHVYEYVP